MASMPTLCKCKQKQITLETGDEQREKMRREKKLDFDIISVIVCVYIHFRWPLIVAFIQI